MPLNLTNTGAAAGVNVVADRAVKTDANVTTTSTSFVDMTGMSVTITTGANRALLLFTGHTENGTAGNDVFFDFDVDGSRQGVNAEGLSGNESEGAAASRCIHMAYLTNALTAASHTFKTQWKVDGGTGTIFSGGTAGDATQATICAIEIPSGTGSPGGAVANRAVKSDAVVETTSTSFVDMTGMSVTMTTGANRVLLTFTGIATQDTGSARDFFDFDVDGTRQGINAEGLTGAEIENVNRERMICASWLTNALTAASHTFKTQWKVSSGTGKMESGGGFPNSQITMTAQEII